MSREPKGPSTVIEWSQGAVMAYDPVARRKIAASSLLDLAPNLSASEAVFAVSRRSCFVRTVRIPDVGKEEARKALALTLSQHVPVDSAEAAFDIRLTQDTGLGGRTATLVAMRSAELRMLHEQAQLAGIKVAAVMPVAFGAALLANEKSVATCAVVSDSTEGVAIDLVTNGDLRYSRVASPGTVLSAIDAELSRTFGAASLPCAPTLASGIKLEDPEFETSETPLEALSHGWHKIGVALDLPEILQAKVKSARANRARLAALLCVSAGLLATLVYLDREDAVAEAQKQQGQMSQSLRDLRNKRSAVESRLGKATALKVTLDRAFSPRQPLTDVVRVLNNHVPQQAWLTGVSLERGGSLVLRGTALSSEDVAKYLEALTTEERLRNVTLLFSNNGRIEETPVVQFSISAFPVGNVPVVEKKVAGTRGRTQ